MKLTKTLLLSGLLLSGFVNAPQAAEDAKPCVQATLGALMSGGSAINTSLQCNSGTVASDPHITTFKGFAYDHNFPGDYTLTELQDGSDFSIVGRFIFNTTGMGSAYTIPKAVKFQWPGHTAEIHRGEEGMAIWVDEKPVKLRDNKSVQIGDVGYISRKGSAYFVANTVSDIATVVYANSFYLDLNVTVPREADTQGLLGKSVNLSLFDRTGLELPVAPDATDPELGKVSHQDFGKYLESWRVANNIFANGDVPTLPDFSSKIYTLADLSQKQLQRAQTQCEALEAVAPEGFNLRNCLFDMGFGGKKFAKSVYRHQVAVMRLEVID